MTAHLAGLVVLFIAAVVAGVINSVAGGGTLLTFPALVGFGVGAIPANATNTAALWPGSLSSAIAYARHTTLRRDLLLPLLIPSVLGALAGAFALVVTPPRFFDRTVPFLVLFATLLFAAGPRLTRRVNAGGPGSHDAPITVFGQIWGFLFQLFVGVYGGYFGAGLGILMLASFSIMGLHDIHRMNALKTLLAAVVNVIAFVFFALKGLVVWPLALMMAVASTIGGYAGARAAKRIPPAYIRAFVIVVGLSVSAWLFAKVITT